MHRSTTINISDISKGTQKGASLVKPRYPKPTNDDRVVSLEMSPIDDTFLSGAIDQTVRLWDLRTPNCRGLLHTPSIPVVAYDTTGAVFAVGLNGYSRVLLYDQSNFDQDPFLTMELLDPSLAAVSFPPRAPFMTSLAFSSHGKYLLIGTAGDGHYVLDAYDGSMVAKLVGHKGLEHGKSPGTSPTLIPNKGISGEEVCWTPDSRFVVSGSYDGKVFVWDLSEPERLKPVAPGQNPPKIEPFAVLDGHPGASRCVRFNPRFAMMATAGAELAFWLPDNGGMDVDLDAKRLLSKMEM